MEQQYGKCDYYIQFFLTFGKISCLFFCYKFIFLSMLSEPILFKFWMLLIIEIKSILIFIFFSFCYLGYLLYISYCIYHVPNCHKSGIKHHNSNPNCHTDDLLDWVAQTLIRFNFHLRHLNYLKCTWN
jgi:hypothetical protein